MLTYAFDLLYAIYEEEGYDPAAIPALILQHNLTGVEIDERAGTLAAFALAMKAAQRLGRRRFLRMEAKPNIVVLQNVTFSPEEMLSVTAMLGEDYAGAELRETLRQFEQAKNFGSLIVPKLGDPTRIQDRVEQLEAEGDLLRKSLLERVETVLRMTEALSPRYHVVVANPPYMGRGAMNSSVALFADEAYPKSKADLFAMFIERNIALLLPHGFNGMVTMQSWMFLPTFETLRRSLLTAQATVSMAHLGARGFDSISGEVVQTTAFVLSKQPPGQMNATFSKLLAGNSEQEKAELFLSGKCQFTIQQSALLELPKAAFAYWLSPQIRSAYVVGKSVEQVTISDGQTKTGDNDRFLRQLWEISAGEVGFGRKWVLHPKGGGNRKWYGNTDFVINWSEAARIHYRKDRVARILPDYLWRRRGICWSNISTSSWLGFRLLTEDEIFNLKSPALFLKQDEQLSFLLGFLNTPIASYLVSSINPTISFNVKDVQDLPLHNFPIAQQNIVGERVNASIAIARTDWDNFETSWDFRDLPLMRPGLKGATLEASWRNWEAQSSAAIRRMQELETENNRLFIAAYGLEGELQPEVSEEQITLARADQRKDIVAFLSYAVGCMMGRYSLDVPGLVLADAGSTLDDYWRIVREKGSGVRGRKGLGVRDEGGVEEGVRDQGREEGVRDQGLGVRESESAAKLPPYPLPLSPEHAPPPQFHPDSDGIIPVTEGEWFADDIVARTREFLRVTFGEAAFQENLRFLEESLGKSLEKYFLSDFYKDHLKAYKKRPIYWLFQSPKKSFQALVYLHRYTKDTVNTLLNSYLRDYLKKLETRIAHLTHVEATAAAVRDQTAARNEREKLEKSLRDCRDWERDTLLPLAQQRIELELDDGVKVNYQKFPGAVAPIPGLKKKED